MSGTVRAAERRPKVTTRWRGSTTWEIRWGGETFLNTFVNNAHIVKMANMAQLVNVIAPIFTNKDSLFLQTIYYPLMLFSNNSRGIALDLFVESPTYTSHKYGQVPYLDVSAAYENGTVVLNVVNRSLDKPVEAHIESQKGSFHGT